MESGVIDGSFIGTASVGYCFTGCRISNGDDHNDTFFGEVKVVSSLPEAARFNPFTVAVNRAQDNVRGKLILQLHGNEFFHRTVSSFSLVR